MTSNPEISAGLILLNGRLSEYSGDVEAAAERGEKVGSGLNRLGVRHFDKAFPETTLSTAASVISSMKYPSGRSTRAYVERP